MYKRILVPLDSGKLSGQAMQKGLELAKQLGASVVGFVVEALPTLPTMGTNLANYQREVAAHEASTEAHAQGLLAGFRQQAVAMGVPFEGLYERHDDIAESIANNAERQACDLIVMATHGRGAFGELLFGSQTKRVMALSKRPLLILH